MVQNFEFIDSSPVVFWFNQNDGETITAARGLPGWGILLKLSEVPSHNQCSQPAAGHHKIDSVKKNGGKQECLASLYDITNSSIQIGFSHTFNGAVRNHINKVVFFFYLNSK